MIVLNTCVLAHHFVFVSVAAGALCDITSYILLNIWARLSCSVLRYTLTYVHYSYLVTANASTSSILGTYIITSVLSVLLLCVPLSSLTSSSYMLSCAHLIPLIHVLPSSCPLLVRTTPCYTSLCAYTFHPYSIFTR